MYSVRVPRCILTENWISCTGTSDLLLMFYSKLVSLLMIFFFFFSSRRRHTRCSRDWSSDVCSSDLTFSPVSKITGDGEVVFAGGVQQVYGAVDAPLVVDGAQVNLNADVTVPRIELDKGALGGPATTTTPDLRWESGSLVGTGKTEIAIGGAGLNVDSPQGHGPFDRALVIDPCADATLL